MIEAYFINLLIIIGIYLILAISLQLCVGYTGLFNLAHIAFFSIGAYTSALLTLNNFSFLISFILAGILSMIFSFILALPTKTIKGDYIALTTLGFSFVVYAISLNWVGLTNGPLGLSGIPRPIILGITFYSNFSFLLLTIIIAFLSCFIIVRITRSRFGKVMEAIRDNELMARVLGKNSFKIKILTFGVSAFFAGIAGSLYASYLSFIDPSSFEIMQIIPILCIIIIGGMTSMKGTIIATVILVLLPESLRFIGLPVSIVGPMRQIIYALVLISILLYRPKGIDGKVEV